MRADRPARCGLFDDLGAAYALDAVEPAERELLEAHLRTCRRCAAELAELRAATARIALSIPQREPPAALGRRILALAATDREAVFSPIHRPDTPAFARPAAPPARSWPQYLALAAALAALLWGASVQVQLNETRAQLSQTQAELEHARDLPGSVVEVLASNDTAVQDLRSSAGAPNASGKLWVDRDSGEGMMMARDLPPLPPDQAYQVWLVRDGTRVSPGFLRPYEDEQGVFYLVLEAPGKLTDYERLGVTIEPAGGSPGPTGPRVIEGEI